MILIWWCIGDANMEGNALIRRDALVMLIWWCIGDTNMEGNALIRGDALVMLIIMEVHYNSLIRVRLNMRMY